MSGCGYTWFDGDSICFKPGTDKDLDRLEMLLDELKNGGYADRIKKTGDVYRISINQQWGQLEGSGKNA